MERKRILLLLVCVIAYMMPSFGQNWQHSWADALQMAQREHKNIVLNFSGSDWCIPCMRMHKTFFDSEAFVNFSNEHLVIYNADFPREKKHQLAKELVKQNEELADQFNKEGHFPLTILLDSSGKVLKTWTGLYKGTVDEFIAELK
ncbi:MAG: hypothetical protein BGN96_02565 [Bacteroidales bacterium 45-6]|nr:MAG: hypothetical protein BGN96_02565 [Bacteroidales bacterium 45-6]